MKYTQLKVVLVALVLCGIIGCGSRDGSKEFELGKEALEVRDLKKAERLFERSVVLVPHDADRLLYLARTELELGELPKAQSALDRVREIAGDDVDVRLMGAQCAWHAKDYKAAAGAYAGIANDAKLEPDVRAQGWAGLGVVEMTCDNHHLARVAFLRAIRLDRRNAAAWYHLGLLYRDGFGYLEAALEQFEIFIRLEEEASPRVQKVQRTVIPALKDQIARAATEHEGASKRNSSACATEIAKAEALWKRGKYKDARDAYAQALKSDPLSYPAALGLARAWEKTDVTKSGQERALDCYKIACTVRPSAVKTFLTAGSLAARLGFSSQAVEIYSRAVAASPNSVDALDGLIRALRKSGGKDNVERAYQQYRESLKKP